MQEFLHDTCQGGVLSSLDRLVPLPEVVDLCGKVKGVPGKLRVVSER